jgi:type VI secretion system protein ImpK
MSLRTERRGTASGQRAGNAATTLLDMMYEGFYCLFLLRSGNAPPDQEAFADKLARIVLAVEKKAKTIGVPAEDLEAAKYAFCATVDEVALGLPDEPRSCWEHQPLQLRVCGYQHAGEHFYARLDEMRARGATHLQALEVYYMCLLLGFKGQYVFGGNDRIDNMCTRLGEEIARLGGKTRGFAPHGARPDQINNLLRSDRSLWVMSGVFALAALGAYLGFLSTLRHHTENALAGYNDIVKLPPRAANVTITLP